MHSINVSHSSSSNHRSNKTFIFFYVESKDEGVLLRMNTDRPELLAWMELKLESMSVRHLKESKGQANDGCYSKLVVIKS